MLGKKLRILATFFLILFILVIASPISSKPTPVEAQTFPPESFYVPANSVLLGNSSFGITSGKSLNVRLYGPDHALTPGEVGNLHVVARFPTDPTFLGLLLGEGIGDDFVIMVGRDAGAGIELDSASVQTEFANFFTSPPTWQSIEAIRNFVQWQDAFRILLLPFTLLDWIGQLVFVVVSIGSFLDWVDSLGLEHGQPPDRAYWTSSSTKRDLLAFGVGANVSQPAYRVTIPYTMSAVGSHPSRVYVKLRTVRNNFFTKDEVGTEFSFNFNSASPIRAGFDEKTFGPNDDGTYGEDAAGNETCTGQGSAVPSGCRPSRVPLGFSINFFGAMYDSVFINNNGNLTFDSPLPTFTPFPLQGTSRVMIAPYFADVDTRSGNLVTFGPGTVGSRPAFGVTWPDVGCFSRNTSVLNIFQVLLVDRSDRGPGDFDMEFNHDKIEWETGQASGGNVLCEGGASARVGYSNGVDTSFELPGSGVPGAFLDSNQNTGLIHNNRNSLQNGRYVFPVVNGVAPTGGTIAGTVFQNPPLAGAFVQVCESGGFCTTTTTNISGQYTSSGLEAGQYTVRAFPPAGTNLQPGAIGPISLVQGQTLTGQDIHLTGPTPPPAGTSITNRGTGGGGLPIIYWNEPLILTTQGCPGGTASYEITLEDGTVIRSGSMNEGPEGTYTATIAPLFPNNGQAHVMINILCPDSSIEDDSFDIYIDPSGTVEDQNGNPIAGATVTLFRSDSSIGPFTQVLDGSGTMSLANRNNPDTTDSVGHFGWDVIAGFYTVRAEAPGCVSPTDPSQNFVETR